MVINSFKYCAPTTLEEACSFLYDQGEEAKLLAGGQSLIPLLKLNLIKPRYVVDLKRIPDLSFISLDQSEDALEIGALTTHSEIVRSSLVCHFTPLLAETALGIGHPLIRNRGTIGGSLCHCDPAADYCPTMLVLEAEMTVVGSGGVTRTVSSKDFIKGTFETDLRRGELLKKVRIKNSNKENEATGYSIKKLTLGHGDFPLIVVSVLLRMKKDSRRIENIAIGLAGVSDKAFRVGEVEKYLLEQPEPSGQHFELAAKKAADLSTPQPDAEVSASYKSRMIQVLTRRALDEAYRRSIATTGGM